MKEIENAEIENMVITELSARHHSGCLLPWQLHADVTEAVRLTLGALDEQRAAARAQQATAGDLTFRDFTAYPDELRAAIDKGHCTGVIGLHRLNVPGEPQRVGMLAGGLTTEDAFDAICIVRRTLMMQMGYVEAEPVGEATQDFDPRTLLGDPVAGRKMHPSFAGDPGKLHVAPEVQSGECTLCHIKHWGVLDRCPHQGCPHGLYRS